VGITTEHLGILKFRLVFQLLVFYLGEKLESLEKMSELGMAGELATLWSLTALNHISPSPPPPPSFPNLPLRRLIVRWGERIRYSVDRDSSLPLAP
jgi:hypothetical protein